MSTTSVSEMLQFEFVRHVTLPPYKLPEDGTPAYLRFETAIEPDKTSFSDRVRKQRSDSSEQQAQKPLDMANVINLQSGEECRLIVHNVLKSTLFEAYPENGYVHKSFRIIKSTEKKGRGANKYYSFEISEIRLKEPVKETAITTAGSTAGTTGTTTAQTTATKQGNGQTRQMRR